jgi:hypothetical protein
MKRAAALTFLSAALFAGPDSMAIMPQGELHSVSANLRQDTLPQTAVLTAHHRTCQKDRTLRDTVVEIEIQTFHIDGIESGKLLELKNDYERMVTPLFQDKQDVTRSQIDATLKHFMDQINSIHFKSRVATVLFLPVAKTGDPCASPARSARLSP